MTLLYLACGALLAFSALFYLKPSRRLSDAADEDLARANLEWFRLRQQELAEEGNDSLAADTQLRLLEDERLDKLEEAVPLMRRLFDGEKPGKAIQAATDGYGVDYAFEAIGNPAVTEAAMQATRRGGKTVIVGMGKLTDNIKVNALTFPLSGKSLCGCMYGSANFKVDFPMYLDLYKAGKLDLDRLITKTYTLDEAPAAFEDMEKGRNARGVIVHA